ncbi:unnamed protein product [Peronospora destructor]|uniref:Polyprotein n=1 Tax=Peronospora destructor TaxID=86335 RepID=A0AAV0TXA7_9STRA|nr:unnamed protein product [Peronospora destructor]
MDDEADLDYFPARSGKDEPSVKSFQSLVGSLLWITRCTRPGICFAVHKATRQTQEPTTKDWKTAKRIVRYLKMSKDLKLHLNGVEPTSEDVQIESWSDADFAADKTDRISLSTMEAEFISASQAGRELLGTKELLNETKLCVREPMPMWIDNQAAIKQLESEKGASSTKHVNIRFKFICHHTQEGTVVPRFVKSQDMMADILTKALPAPRMEELRALFKLKATQDVVEEEC